MLRLKLLSTRISVVLTAVIASLSKFMFWDFAIASNFGVTVVTNSWIALSAFSSISFLVFARIFLILFLILLKSSFCSRIAISNFLLSSLALSSSSMRFDIAMAIFLMRCSFTFSRMDALASDIDLKRAYNSLRLPL